MRRLLISLLFLLPSVSFASIGGGSGGSSSGGSSPFTITGSSTPAIQTSADQFKIQIAGGDFKISPTSVTLNGSAISGSGGSSKFNEYLTPLNVRLSSTSNCVVSNSTNSVYPALLCDAAADEAFNWVTNLKNYTGTSLSLKIFYSMASATSGKVRLDAEAMCSEPMAAADIDIASYAASVSSAVTVPGTAGYLYTATIALTDDTCHSGDLISIQGRRVAADGANDTATGDLEIRGALLYEP